MEIPLTYTGFVHADQMPERTEHWLDVSRRYHEQGVKFWPQLSPRTVDFRVNWDSSMMFMAFPAGWHRVIQAPAPEKRRLLDDAGWRGAARAEWDTVPPRCSRTAASSQVRFVEVSNPDDEKWLGRTLAELVAARGGHPSDVLADFVLANDCRPGIVAVGIANADVDGVARTLADPLVLVSSSDSGAHVQMLCASGDTTLFLTRHVRERGDFTVEAAVHELTGRQADVFGFRDRGVVEPGRAGGSRRVRARRAALGRRRLRPRSARRHVPAPPPRGWLPGDGRQRRRRSRPAAS